MQANATALLPNVATCISSAAVFHAAGDVDWSAAALVALSAAATTRVGARLAHHLPEHRQKALFGLAMCALGPAIAAKPLLQRQDAAPAAASLHDAATAASAAALPATPLSAAAAPLSAAAAVTPLQPLADAAAPPAGAAAPAFRVPGAGEAAYLLCLGSVTGLCSGVMGIGAGVMCTVGLAVGGPSWFTHKMVLGTAFAAQLLPHATGAFTHWQLGNLRMDLVPALVLGSAVGSALASRVAVTVDEELLRNLFAAYALGLGMHNLRAAVLLSRIKRV